MNKKLENSLYVVAEDAGSLEGLALGVLAGVLEVAQLPSFIRQKVNDDNENFMVDAHQIEYNIVNSVGFLERGKGSLIRQEMVARFNKCGQMMAKPTASLARYALTIGMVVDLSDGRPHNVGYLAVPAAVSLLYEGYRYMRRRYDLEYKIRTS